MALEKARSRRARTLLLAQEIPSWESRPRTLQELDALLDVRGLPPQLRPAVRQAFQRGDAVFFVRDRALYATRTGLLSRQWVLNQYATGLEGVRLEMQRTAAQVVRGGDLQTLHSRMVAMLEQSHVEALRIIFGPNPPADAAATAGRLLRQQRAYLDRMFADITGGRQKRDGTLTRRAMMYAGSGWGAAAEMSRLMAVGEGWHFEENVLGDAEHCGGCIEETGRGRVPIGTLVPIGQRDCLSNCRCYLRYS